MLLGIDVLLLLVVAAGSKRGGGGIEACEGSDGDLITEALTDDVTEGNPPCSEKKPKYFVVLSLMSNQWLRILEIRRDEHTHICTHHPITQVLPYGL